MTAPAAPLASQSTTAAARVTACVPLRNYRRALVLGCDGGALLRLASLADRLVAVDADPDRVMTAAQVTADWPQVRVQLEGDGLPSGVFDLVVDLTGDLDLGHAQTVTLPDAVLVTGPAAAGDDRWSELCRYDDAVVLQRLS